MTAPLADTPAPPPAAAIELTPRLRLVQRPGGFTLQRAPASANEIVHWISVQRLDTAGALRLAREHQADPDTLAAIYGGAS